MVLNGLMGMTRFYPIMRQAIEDSGAPDVRAELERQYEHIKRLRELAMEAKPLDMRWVDPDPQLRLSARRYFSDLGTRRTESLLRRLSPDAVEAYRRVFA